MRSQLSNPSANWTQSSSDRVNQLSVEQQQHSGDANIDLETTETATNEVKL